MGRELKLQAIIENSEIVRLARENEEFAELLSFFSKTAQTLVLFPEQEDQLSNLFVDKVKDVVRIHPSIGERSFYGAYRKWDAIEYLLCEKRRRKSTFLLNTSLIHVATYGNDIINPNRAPQGHSIGLVSSEYVHKIAENMLGVTFGQFKEFWHPATMWESGVYKIDTSDDERTLVDSWNEFQNMSSFYQQVAEHDEATITMLV